ncbi:MAG: NAD(P)-dependent dehydrogenase (short-subunit alcohol dehydrogenase family) [Paracoccaceae bacterium]|jgi:NAD(P)-dependent dehydrogenase (short-subunit alcohol dehydrogenase family)
MTLENRSAKKVALVTGGNRGIGLDIARQLQQQNMQVIATRRADSAAVDTEAVLGLDSQILDVSDHASVTKLAAYIKQTYGRLDVLVNNAGIALDKWVPALSLSIDDYRATMETNLYGVLRCCQAFVPMMQAQKSGRVVNLSSELGTLTDVQWGSSLAYRSSKTALNSLTALLACELKDYPNILVNASCPGWVRTELGGDDAPLSVAEGADTAVWLATLPAGGPTGGLFRERAPYPW